MIIAGASGHALEVLTILEENNFPGRIYFFDDVKALPGSAIFGYQVITSTDEAKEIFSADPDFVLGVGKPAIRKLLHEKLQHVGGQLQSVISKYAHIGKHAVELGEGLNIMTSAVITGRSTIGKGSLVHIHCSIHHDTVIGEYCELSPGCRILGGALIGSFVSIGAGAVVLPGVQVGNNVVVGAGSVLTKNVPDNAVVKGVPGRW